MTRLSTPTLIGLAAIGLWSTLALLTAATGTLPPFLLAALTFSIGGALGAGFILSGHGSLSALAQPWPVWLHGVGGLFGYHACYFAALKLAPPAEASLLAYLWPLLIVVFAALLPGERLRRAHLAGAALGLCGVAVLLGGPLHLSAESLPGYLAALAAAVIWAAYSVVARLFAAVPTEAVAGFCIATAALSFGCHLLFEPAAWPSGRVEWLSVAALGVGPVGAAFFAWDRGMKRGDVPFLGIASYAAPVLSTVLLVVSGYAQARWQLGAACCLIVLGAFVGSRVQTADRFDGR